MYFSMMYRMFGLAREADYRIGFPPQAGKILGVDFERADLGDVLASVIYDKATTYFQDPHDQIRPGVDILVPIAAGWPARYGCDLP